MKSIGNISELLSKRMPWLMTAKASSTASWIFFGVIILVIAKILASCFWSFFPNYQESGNKALPSVNSEEGNRNFVDDILSLGFFPVNYEKLKVLKVHYGSDSKDITGENRRVGSSASNVGGSSSNSVVDNNIANASGIAKLPLTITGILASNDPSKSQTVVIYNSNEQLYGEGDVIEGTSAKIVGIYVDHIDVKYKDITFSYPFDADDSALSAVSLDQASSQNEKKDSLRASDEKITAKNLMDFVTISPIKDGTSVKGYRLNPGKKPELFEKVGLKNNDLAVKVNGYDLTDQEQTKKLFKEYNTMTSFEITVDRDGVLENVYLDVAN